jgi:hypothetical protein
MQHSNIVGGSSASRVINCPGSVALVAKAPPKPSSSYADEGTLLHNAADIILDKGKKPQELIGMTYGDIVLTKELVEDKLQVALHLLEEVDPNFEMDYMTETVVEFGDFLPGVFGSTDLMGRIGKRAYVIDWKFGSGVIVDAEENSQLLFYAAAAMRTPSAKWVFDGAEEIEMIIIQPPEIRRWITTFERVKRFENELVAALIEAKKPEAKLFAGDHCKWCAAKPTCPQMTGAVERALKKDLKTIDVNKIASYLGNAVLLEGWISSLRELAQQMLENDVPVPGMKLVAKRATRSWADESKSKTHLLSVLPKDEVITEKIISPAQAEKVLKKAKLDLPKELIVAISSGNTMVEDSDPRPAVKTLGAQMTASLKKIQ